MKTKLFSFILAVSLSIMGLPVSSQAGQHQKTMQGTPKSNLFWWPNLIDLSPLRQHAKESSPYSDDFDYAAEFASVDLNVLKKELTTLMKTSQDWWPADWGHYGPLFIRMAWHSAGTYRTIDGRGGAGGGQQRFEPLNSWPDNANLDKARRLLWPIKQKYGKKLSWADLMILAGNVALESMGFETLGFAGGRLDDWEPDLVYWGPEVEMLATKRHANKTKRKLQGPLGATHMGLIYVNPEGPDGRPDPLLAAKDIRETFGRMAMDDAETVALIAGGHTFGKNHGAHKASKCLASDPAGSGLEEQGFGWKNKCGKGNAEDTVTSGLEGAWTSTPTKWSMQYLETLFAFDWKLTTSPGGAKQWRPTNKGTDKLVADAHVKGKRVAPVMLTTDLSLKFDPAYKKISKRFLENPKEFEKAFARAWFKLTHRDMGPRARYVGSDVPSDVFTWQDPVSMPEKSISKRDASKLKKKILESGLSVAQLVRTAWASASSFRSTDMRGGANGARLALAPQKDWKANNPKELSKVLQTLKSIQEDYGKKVSLADMIVLGGAAAIEKAAKDAGHKVKVPFVGGRGDATQKQTDVASFAVLEPKADAFRNYFDQSCEQSPTYMMVDKANLLALTVPEMTALVGGMRALGANADGSTHGVLTDTPGQLTNDFFVNLLDMSTEWKKSKKDPGLYEGVNRKTGKVSWTATPVDLAFGSSSELRAISEVYAANDGHKKFVNDFVKAWTKVMQLDRFDLQ